MGQSLDTFLNLIWGESNGFVYVGHKTPNSFNQHFFSWPSGKLDIQSRITELTKTGETYICPSIFTEANGKKDYVLGSRVAWVDFDAGMPDTWKDIPEPNILVETSEGHCHAYWSFDKQYDVETVEKINRKLAYSLEADTSGWDANQLLRPPETINHKRSAPVVLLQGILAANAPSAFQKVADPPFKVSWDKVPDVTQLPSMEQIMKTHTIPKDMQRLLTNPAPDGKRSNSLMALGYRAVEIGLNDSEVLSVLLAGDLVHQKFANRPDSLVRILEILGKAKTKQETQEKPDELIWIPLSPTGLLSQQIQLEWIWKPYLFRRGSLILSGPPGVGKSQFSSSLAQALVLGQTFLGIETPGNLRIGFLSLEMDQVELQYIIRAQIAGHTPEEVEKLNESLFLFPIGYPLNFSDGETQENVKRLISKYELDGLIIDSLSSTNPEELASEKEAKKVFAFDAILRQQFGIFTLYIHHNRKAQSDNRKPTKLADLHGSVHLGGKTSSVIYLWPEPNGTMSLISPKVRLGLTPPERRIQRDANLHMVDSKMQSPNGFVVKNGDEVVDTNEGPNDSIPGPPNGDFGASSS